jgi:hypothetical protein
MRGWALFSGCILVTVAVNCTGPDRLYVDAGDTSATSSGGGGASSSSGSGGASTSSTSTTTSSSSGGGTGGAAPTCADATHACVEEAPSGWVGPFALYAGPGAAPPCANAYPDAVGDYHGELDEGTPTCDCACDPATGISCTGSAQICYPGSGVQACITICQGTKTNLPPNQCVSVPTSASTNISISEPTPTQIGSCTPNATKSIPTPTWGVNARACGGAAMPPTGCASGEVCAPIAAAPYDTLCVVASGDVDCPDAFYAKKNTFYDSFTDTRDCSACTCGTASSKCGGKVSFTHPGCGGGSLLDEQKNAGYCGSYGTGFDSATYYPSPSGTCPPSGGELTGMVTPNGATTVCCH